MSGRDVELLDTQTKEVTSATAPLESDASRGISSSVGTLPEPTADSDTASARALEAENLARQMKRKAERYLKMTQHLGAALDSGKVRRRTAWQRPPRTR